MIPDATDDRPEAATVSTPTTFGEDACGHLYVAGQGGGNNVFRITSTDPPQDICPDAFPLPTLTASVTDNGSFEIHMRDPKGQELDGQTLPQGTYKLEIDDNGSIHKFHLVDNDFLLGQSFSCVPATDCATDIAGTGHDNGRPYAAKGGSGWGVRLLLELARAQAPATA